MAKKESVIEALAEIRKAQNNPINIKIISVIGSCKTTHQLDSCKTWFENVVKDEESKLLLYLMTNLRFGQIDCGIDI